MTSTLDPLTGTTEWAPRRRPAVIALSLLVALMVGACAADEGDQPAEGPGEAQIAAGGGLIQGALADIPVPDAADAQGGPNEVDGVQTQNYSVTAMSPLQLLDFYVEELPALGWTEVDRQSADESERGTWEMDGFVLLIAAAPEGASQETSLSLQLSDEGSATPEGGVPTTQAGASEGTLPTDEASE